MLLRHLTSFEAQLGEARRVRFRAADRARDRPRGERRRSCRGGGMAAPCREPGHHDHAAEICRYPRAKMRSGTRYSGRWSAACPPDSMCASGEAGAERSLEADG